MKTKVQVKDLRAGDVLSTGDTVISAPVAGFTTPKGKMEFKVCNKGFEKSKLWGKYTTVTVNR